MGQLENWFPRRGTGKARRSSEGVGRGLGKSASVPSRPPCGLELDREGSPLHDTYLTMISASWGWH